MTRINGLPEVPASATSSRAPSAREVWDQMIRHHLDADIDGFADMFAVDGVMEVPFAPKGLPGRMEGREEIRRTLTPLWNRGKKIGRRIVGYEPVIVHETRDPEVVVVEFDVHSEMSGASLRLSYVHILRAREGRVVHLRDYMDSARLGERLQVMAAVATALDG